MKLTKKKSLELSIELWTWMFENIGKNKIEWPRWSEFIGIEGGDIEAECFLCEYDLMQSVKYDFTKDMCRYCPLKKEFVYCDNLSPFRIWKTTPNYENTKIMLDLMKNKYIELYEEN